MMNDDVADYQKNKNEENEILFGCLLVLFFFILFSGLGAWGIYSIGYRMGSKNCLTTNGVSQ